MIQNEKTDPNAVGNCDLCGKPLARMWVKQTDDFKWQFKGKFAHLECYIDHCVKISMKKSNSCLSLLWLFLSKLFRLSN